MSCQETQALIHAYLDGELDLVRSVEIQRHLDMCRNCALDYRNHQSLRSLMRGGSLYFKAPATLETRLRASLSDLQATEADRVQRLDRTPSPRHAPRDLSQAPSRASARTPLEFF